MNRKDFLKWSALSLTPLLLPGCGEVATRRRDYDISFRSGQAAGHQIFQSKSWPNGDSVQTDVLVVGGGLAGLSAAHALRDRDLMLCELHDRLGGTASSGMHGELPFAQGAHYDLAYPSNYGKEVLSVLEELQIIQFNDQSELWEFRDKQFLIPDAKEERVLANGTFQEGVFPRSLVTDQFIKLVKEFSGKLPMPTRLIESDLRELDQIDFWQYLNTQFQTDPEFEQSINYQMRDDYGGGAAEVSALAGLHYFACRPYYTDTVELFSPPQGNAYFVDRLAQQLAPGQVKLSHLVKQIKPEQSGFAVEVLDLKGQQQFTIQANQVVMAGPKHTLRHLLPEEYGRFSNIEYSPWMVLTLMLKEDPGKEAFWQNDILSTRSELLGFVDSGAQHTPNSKQRFLSLYYSFRPEERAQLVSLPTRLQEVAQKAVSVTSDYFGIPLDDLVEKVYINLMGHAMPIPGPGYLFNDRNVDRKYPNLVYAGVDNGRLPLLFEAMDSGLMAAKLLKEISS